ncbi:uncharacterized protein RJT20DRAFT_145618 [Scheffersomyces xylosifermentans]|uniref:uncharacterized protein n=1 Tax=Scheffersomyces xylosifermentans TaxID=1304137 RepID=UPI00315CAC92
MSSEGKKRNIDEGINKSINDGGEVTSANFEGNEDAPDELSGVLLNNLPLNEKYKYSYKNESVVSCLNASSIVVTGLKNGIVKFWKRQESSPEKATSAVTKDTNDEDAKNGLECVKTYKAHPNKEIAQLLIDKSGSQMVSIAKDDTSIKVFDLTTLDMISVVDLKFVPNTKTPYSNVWFEVNNTENLLISESGSNNVYIVSTIEDEIKQIESPHKHPISSVIFNDKYKCFISSDVKGILEYWTLEGSLPRGISFKYKSETDLFDVAKSKSQVSSMSISSDQETFASFSFPDCAIRLFNFKSESVKKYEDEVDLKTLNREKMIMNNNLQDLVRSFNLVFDSKDRVLVYSSIVGIKIVSLQTYEEIKTLGTEDQDTLGIRFNQLVLLNNLNVDTISSEMLSSKNSIIQSKLARRPLIVTTAINSDKLFVFDNTKSELADRDIDLTSNLRRDKRTAQGSYNKVTLHTTLGDIKINLFTRFVPRTVENFVKLCQKRYYNTVIFHRVIKGFMVQTGDPSGDGTGGESIWGGHFEDEFNPNLSHSKPFMVSMANAGPNTNGSQFFITTEATRFLDNKHTIFGEVSSGFDTVRNIESVETDENDRPLEQIAILSTTLES